LEKVTQKVIFLTYEMYEFPEVTTWSASNINSQNGESSREGAMRYVVYGDKVSYICATFRNYFRKDLPGINQIYAWHKQFS
jgi:hypothetical protein